MTEPLEQRVALGFGDVDRPEAKIGVGLLRMPDGSLWIERLDGVRVPLTGSPNAAEGDVLTFGPNRTVAWTSPP
jgi:hypothetical protein